MTRSAHANPMADPTQLPPSLWAATARPGLDCPPVLGSQDFDIAVVGGGYTGLSAAIACGIGRARVCVLEAGEPGWGASGRNGGQVIAGLKHDPDDLVARFGAERGENLVRFVSEAPDQVFELVDRYRIDCDAVRSGWIQAAHSPGALKTLAGRVEQWAERGVDVRLLDHVGVRDATGSKVYHGAMFDRRGGKLQPLSYVRGLVRAAVEEGAVVSGDSPVTNLERVGHRWRITTPSATISADRVIIATNAYTGDLVPPLGKTVLPIASFIVATAPLAPDVADSILPHGQATSDTRRLLTYTRRDPDGRLIVGARGTYRDPRGSGDFAHVEEEARRLFPQIRDVAFQYHWSGRVAVTADYMPHIHQPGPGLMAVLGYCGRGVAMATALGIAAGRNAVHGKDAPLPLPPVPVRPIPLHGARRFYVAAAAAWYRLLDRAPWATAG